MVLVVRDVHAATPQLLAGILKDGRSPFRRVQLVSDSLLTGILYYLYLFGKTSIPLVNRTMYSHSQSTICHQRCCHPCPTRQFKVFQ